MKMAAPNVTASSAISPPGPTGTGRRHLGTVAVVLVLVLVAAVRIRLRFMPLDRDEGESAYAGQLVLQGIPPYRLAYNVKFPGAYAAYALIFAVGGQAPAAIHVGIAVVTTLTALLLYRIARTRLDETAGVVASTAFAVLAASPSLSGLAGHAPHFCVLFATAALGLLWPIASGITTVAAAAGGLCLGLGVLMTPYGAVFALAGLVWVATTARSRRRAVFAFALGAALPLAVTGFLLWRAGVVETFWLWAIRHARFRDHDFLLGLPAVSLLVGVGVSMARRLRGQGGLSWPAWIYAFTLSAAAYAHRDIWLEATPMQAARSLHPGDPLIESEPLADYIRSSSTPQARVAVLGSEPQIYFLSHRLAASGYLHMYPLMAPQPFARRMQEDMIQDIEAARPEYVVLVSCRSSWVRRPDSATVVFEWWSRLFAPQYDRVAAAILDPNGGPTRYLWGADAAELEEVPADAALVYRRVAPTN
jgi:hypothetical protein